MPSEERARVLARAQMVKDYAAIVEEAFTDERSN
jgi:hypothetical protein